MKEIYESYSDKDTLNIANKIAKSAKPSEIYALEGDLGAGKTVFAKGFARGLDIAEVVNSPTFTILQVYDTGRLPLYHYDVYRIVDIDEMYEVGFEEFIFGKGVSLIEWASRIKDLLPKETIWININYNRDKGIDYREIVVNR